MSKIDPSNIPKRIEIGGHRSIPKQSGFKIGSLKGRSVNQVSSETKLLSIFEKVKARLSSSFSKNEFSIGKHRLGASSSLKVNTKVQSDLERVKKEKQQILDRIKSIKTTNPTERLFQEAFYKEQVKSLENVENSLESKLYDPETTSPKRVTKSVPQKEVEPEVQAQPEIKKQQGRIPSKQENLEKLESEKSRLVHS